MENVHFWEKSTAARAFGHLHELVLSMYEYELSWFLTWKRSATKPVLQPSSWSLVTGQWSLVSGHCGQPQIAYPFHCTVYIGIRKPLLLILLHLDSTFYSPLNRKKHFLTDKNPGFLCVRKNHMDPTGSRSYSLVYDLSCLNLDAHDKTLNKKNKRDSRE